MQEIIKAMLNVSEKLKNPGVNAINPHFKNEYTTLDKLIDHIKPLLLENGLLVIQGAEEINGKLNIITKVFHESGENIETSMSMPYGTDAQKTCAAVTYGRRAALSAMFNIASDPDNDGEDAIGRQETNYMPNETDIYLKLDSLNTIDSVNDYGKELSGFNFPDLAKGRIKKYFDKRRKEISGSFKDQISVDNLLEGN